MSRYDTDNFDVDVLERSREKPVLVDFWAAWCGPCRVIGPVLERLADDNGDDWELRKLDTEKHPDIARQYRITSIPAVKLFVDGEVKDEFVGALPEQMIVLWLKKPCRASSGSISSGRRRYWPRPTLARRTTSSLRSWKTTPMTSTASC